MIVGVALRPKMARRRRVIVWVIFGCFIVVGVDDNVCKVI